MGSLLLGYRPWAGDLSSQRNGVLTASQPGVAVAYGLANAQERGTTFIEAGEQVYEGMIVGLNRRGEDIAVNVCKEKQKTNVRSSTSDISVRLTPALKMSLEQCLDFLGDDELLEVTPKGIRLRKRFLSQADRARRRSRAAHATSA
jgi:GTP-binding protein